MPGRQVFETICAALETYKTANRRRWAVHNAMLRVGQVETALGLREAGIQGTSSETLPGRT